MKLNNKFAIGCLAQWYEIEIFEEYIESVMKSLMDIDNKKNVTVDIMVNLSQSLEEVDREQLELGEIFQRYLKIRQKLWDNRISAKFNFYPAYFLLALVGSFINA